MKIVIATKNKGKVKEFSALLYKENIEILSLEDFPEMPEIVENGVTFMENALLKAKETVRFTGLCSLADDSGLETDALGGMPGVLSARFAPTPAECIEKLLKMMENVPVEKRTARFKCALALVRPDGFKWTCEKSCEGIITNKPSGNSGFGYDPVFFYKPMGKTFAEIEIDIKNEISHRGKALKEFLKAVKNNGIIAG